MHEGEPSARQVARGVHLIPALLSVSWALAFHLFAAIVTGLLPIFLFPSPCIHLYAHLEGRGEGGNGNLPGNRWWVLECLPMRKHALLGSAVACWGSGINKQSPVGVVIALSHSRGALSSGSKGQLYDL